jgi:hypothetical protein
MMDAYQMMNVRNTRGYIHETKISGYWMDQAAFDISLGSYIEDLLVEVEYRITDESFDHEFGRKRQSGVEVIRLHAVYGQNTGTEYTGQLRLTQTLVELLEDQIMEELEV